MQECVVVSERVERVDGCREISYTMNFVRGNGCEIANIGPNDFSYVMFQISDLETLVRTSRNILLAKNKNFINPLNPLRCFSKGELR